MSDTIQDLFGRLQRLALGIGTLALLGCLAGLWLDPVQLGRSWLHGYLFWLELSLGSLALTMLHNLTGGSWGRPIRALTEAASRNLWLMALLFLPVALSIGHLYPWVHPEGHGDGAGPDPLLVHKAPYLNVPFFLARAVLYFLVWLGLAYALDRATRAFERDPGLATARRLRVLSGPGLVVAAGAFTFASFDWAMSLEPHWFSTIYGLFYVVGSGLLALSFSTLVVTWLGRRPPYRDAVEPGMLHDLGNLIFAFVFLYAYLSFSQFLIIWSGNLPEETPWYMNRMAGGWDALGLFLVAFHFALPFVLLLQRVVKRNLKPLGAIVAMIFVVHLLALFWFIAPAFHPGRFHLHWLDLLTPLAIGGLWLGLFLRQLRSRELLPLRQLEEEDAHAAEAHG
jgi:hypothetical protein